MISCRRNNLAHRWQKWKRSRHAAWIAYAVLAAEPKPAEAIAEQRNERQARELVAAG